MKPLSPLLAIRAGRLLVPLALPMLLFAGPALGITFTVNSKTDLGDATPGNGFCWTGQIVPPSAAECTLRAALEEANAYPGADTIDFSSGLLIDPFGSISFFPNTSLPTIVDPVTIDGTTAPSYATGDPWAVPVVHLNGNMAGPSAHGLRLLSGADGSAILGIGIVDFALDGIKIGQFSPPEGVNGLRIEGCHIGLFRGTGLGGNGDDGIEMTLQAVSANNLIGAECQLATGCLGRGNVIAANGGEGVVVNGPGNKVAGNRIGTTHDGTAVSGTGNGGFGILVESGAFNQVGSSAFYMGVYVAAGNLLSGNGAGGLSVIGDDTTIVANRIGTDVTGTIALPNTGPGIWIQSNGNSVGNPTAGLAVMNLVSGNTEDGIRISGDDNDVDVNRVGVSVDGGGAMPNGGDGIRIVSGSGNQISGNEVSANLGDGIEIGGSGNGVSSNLIGMDDDGTDLGNGGSGIHVTGTANQIGDVGIGNSIGFNIFGIRLETGASLNAVEGNSIGTVLGLDRGNGADGVLVLGSGNVIGGSDSDPSAEGNEIGFNGDDGVEFDALAVGNTLLGNWIGVSAGGADLGNTGHGVRMAGSGNVVGALYAPPGNVAAAGNAIAHNGGNGVRMDQVAAITNPIRGNRIQSNGGIGIDLGGPGATPNDAFDGDSGANRLQNTPVLDPAVAGVDPGSGQVVVRYYVDSATLFASYPLVVDFYLSNGGDGAVWIGSDEVNAPDAGLDRTIAFAPPTGVVASGSIVATATDSESTGNTSEFGAAVALPEPSPTTGIVVCGLVLAALLRRRSACDMG